VITILRSVALLLITLISFGCTASNYYNVPRDAFEKKVKILGVAPIFIDTESDIRHPEKDALLNLIRSQNRANEKELVSILKNTGTFFSVRLLDDDADKMFSSMLFRRERRDDASVVYNKYFYKLPDLKDLVTKNGLDAVMITVVSGLTRQDTVRSSNLISYLKGEYNLLVMTSQIFDADGNILWEFPNFRENNPYLPALVELQYPNFDEAKANGTDLVDVKFKTIPGISRYLNEAEDSNVAGGAKASKAYVSVFNDMADLLKPEKKFLWWGKKEDKSGGTAIQQVPRTGEYVKPETVKQETVSPTATTKPVQPEVIKEEPLAQPIKEEKIKEETIK
jgi:hypothetical protein